MAASGRPEALPPYSHGQRIRHAMMAAHDPSQRLLEEACEVYAVTDQDKDFARIGRTFLLSWLDSGFQLIRVGPKRAALFAATTISAEALAEFRWPWPAFVVETDDLQVEFNSYANGNVSMSVEPRGYSHTITWSGPPEGMLTCGFEDVGDADAAARFFTIAIRIVLGACLSLSTPEARHTAERRGRRERNQSAALKFLPGVRYVLGNDVKVDLTSHIREYLERGGSSPKVRTLVCGHHKWQAHGPQLTLRKYVWIQPYIRGPEGAPMTVRAHSIADGNDAVGKAND
jgi:hypothetical protein